MFYLKKWKEFRCAEDYFGKKSIFICFSRIPLDRMWKVITYSLIELPFPEIDIHLVHLIPQVGLMASKLASSIFPLYGRAYSILPKLIYCTKLII